ncbi:hypothetical protein E4U42_001673 [Claviceps africana]|uniref:Choline permease n=1 Tax=Claviceps africana TaxID=83212 RepID=A0A8K0NK84_9HYPO|nr:hypothetical protein E4U42_001673 [Claviceps africana]
MEPVPANSRRYDRNTGDHTSRIAAAADDDDTAALEAMGHKQELKRNFSMMSMLGLAFAIINTWPALAASINLALPSGGTSAVIWGLAVAGICNVCLAASLAEFLSAYPTAGGQYHWAAMISWKTSGRAISYTTGWITVCGWVALSAAGPLVGSTFVFNIVQLLHPAYEAQPWHQFLVYVAFALIALVLNALLTRWLPYFTKAAFLWSVAGLVVIVISVLACASPNFQTGGFVYGQFVNNTGWPDGLAWMLGLLQSAFSLTGFDATAHMIEEIPDPHRQGPKIMLYCIGIGVFTGFIFLSGLLFCINNVNDVISAPWGPLLQIFMDATKSKAGSTCLLLLPLLCMVFATVTIICTSTRMSYAFARDGGMPFSGFFARVHPTLEVPLNALFWTVGWVIVFGCIFLGSSSTFNAITSASVVALGVTYAIPPGVNLLRGRSMLPEDRPFRIPGAWGWIINLIGIAWTTMTTVLFVFPPQVPVTAKNMNYCIVAFSVMLVIAGATWVFDGRKHYKGPRVKVPGLKGRAGTGTEPQPLCGDCEGEKLPEADGVCTELGGKV